MLVEGVFGVINIQQVSVSGVIANVFVFAAVVVNVSRYVVAVFGKIVFKAKL